MMRQGLQPGPSFFNAQLQTALRLDDLPVGVPAAACLPLGVPAAACLPGHVDLQGRANFPPA